jgi:hypothetical protein
MRSKQCAEAEELVVLHFEIAPRTVSVDAQISIRPLAIERRRERIAMSMSGASIDGRKTAKSRAKLLLDAHFAVAADGENCPMLRRYFAPLESCQISARPSPAIQVSLSIIFDRTRNSVLWSSLYDGGVDATPTLDDFDVSHDRSRAPAGRAA